MTTCQLDLDAFRAACHRVAPALGSRVPIFLGLRLVVGTDQTTVEAQSEAMHFGATVGGGSNGDSVETIVPGRTLLRFLDSVQGQILVIALDDVAQTTRFACGEVELTLRHFDPTEWTKTDMSSELAVDLEANDLASIGRILFAASTDADRGLLTGVHIRSGCATATDNYRLARAGLSASLPECVVPAPFLSLVLKGLDVDENLRFELGTQRLCLRNGSGFWSSQLLVGDYPDVSSVLNLATTGEIVFDRSVLKGAIDRVSVLDRVSAVQVAVLDGSTVEITAGDDEVGRLEERIGCRSNWTGTLGFLLAHLRDAIRAVSDDHVVMRPSTGLKPVLMPSTGLEQSILPRKID